MNCSAYDPLGFDDWGEILTAPLQGGRYPVSATMELTNRCNFGCPHCYINEAANDDAARDRELTTEQVKAIIDQMVAAGVMFLTLTGGEPLLRPDFAEIYTYARENGLLVVVFTNGTLITDEIIALFTELRPFSIEISIYGATAPVFERVSGLPGSFARCHKAIERVVAAGLPLTLKTELITLNYQELPQMKAYADQLGVNFRYDGMLWPRLDGKAEFPRDVQIPLEVLVSFDAGDHEREAAVDKELDRLKHLKGRDERVFSCGAGVRSFHVDCEGRLSICMMVRQPAYNILEMPLIEAFEKLGSLREMKRKSVSKCQSCTLNIMCSHCPGWSLAIHGNYETVVKSVCEYGTLRTNNAFVRRKIGVLEGLENYG